MTEPRKHEVGYFEFTSLATDEERERIRELLSEDGFDLRDASPTVDQDFGVFSKRSEKK